MYIVLNISSLNRAKYSRWNYREIHKTGRSSPGLNPSLFALNKSCGHVIKFFA